MVINIISNQILICWGRSQAKKYIILPITYTIIPIVNVGDEHGGTAIFSAPKARITTTQFYLKAMDVHNAEYSDYGNWISVGF